MEITRYLETNGVGFKKRLVTLRDALGISPRIYIQAKSNQLESQTSRKQSSRKSFKQRKLSLPLTRQIASSHNAWTGADMPLIQFCSLNFMCITPNTNFCHTWIWKALFLRLILRLDLQILRFWPITLLFKLQQSTRCNPRMFYWVIFVCYLLSWIMDNNVYLFLVAKGIIVLPKSVTPARISSNFIGAIAAANKLRFDTADLQRLDGLAASGKQKR